MNAPKPTDAEIEAMQRTYAFRTTERWRRRFDQRMKFVEQTAEKLQRRARTLRGESE